MSAPLADRFRTILLLRVCEAEKYLADFAEGRGSAANLEVVLGLFHTLKGESKMLGLSLLYQAAESLEDRLEAGGAHDGAAMPATAKALMGTLARIAAALGPGLTAGERDQLISTLHEPPPAAKPRHRVLVVDDSPIVCELVSELLMSEGLDVEIAHDGAEALSALDARLPDLVLSDVEMPTMDGFSLLERTRQRAKNLPFVLLTTRSSPQDRHRAATLGASAYLIKSDFENGILLSTVSRFLDRPS
jgi:CheY-like chemotaxis protein/HPt (histidine-containing phosphotransfer) domain-containing protein